MNLLDLLIIVAAIGAAIGGYRLGFVTRAFSWIGLALGIVVANLVLPGVVRRFDGSEHQGAMLAIAVGIFILGAFAGQGLGMIVGRRFHVRRAGLAPPGRRRRRRGRRRRRRRGRRLAAGTGHGRRDRVAGPPGARVRAGPRRSARSCPTRPTPPTRCAGWSGTATRRCSTRSAPRPSLGPPPAETGLDQATAQRIAASTVRLESEACDSRPGRHRLRRRPGPGRHQRPRGRRSVGHLRRAIRRHDAGRHDGALRPGPGPGARVGARPRPSGAARVATPTSAPAAGSSATRAAGRCGSPRSAWTTEPQSTGTNIYDTDRTRARRPLPGRRAEAGRLRVGGRRRPGSGGGHRVRHRTRPGERGLRAGHVRARRGPRPAPEP